MSALTQDEIRLLQELEQCERTISGNRSRNGLRRLVEAGYVTEQALNISETIYSITPAGRIAAQAVKER